MRLRVASEAARPAIRAAARQHGLQVLPFVFRHARIFETADLRMAAQAAVQQRCAAAVQSGNKYKGMREHIGSPGPTPKRPRHERISLLQNGKRASTSQALSRVEAA